MIPNVRDTVQKVYWETHPHGRQWGHPVIAFFVEQRLKYAERFIDWSTLKNVLDVGCGYGNALSGLRERIAWRVGMDQSFAMLSGCPQGMGQRIQARVTALPFRDSSFDCVLGWELLHHVEKPEEALKEFARVARRYVLLFEPNRYNPGQFLLGLLDRSERGTLRFSRNKLETLAKEAGFTVLHAETVGAIFPNRMPTFLLPLARLLPFSLPGIGISSLVIGLKKEVD